MSTTPSIAAQLTALAELARLDAKGKTVSERLESVPLPAKKADEGAATLKKKVAEAHARKEAAERQKKVLEGEAQEEKKKIKKWESRADELRGEREHAALVSEIGATRGAIRRLEDQQLEQMEIAETAQKDLEALTPKLKKAEEDARAEWHKLDGELEALREEASSITTARKALLERLPAPVVKRYEQIAARRQGVGVAIIKGEVCSGCRCTLPPQLCLQVRKGLVLESCSSCNRLLVHEEMTRAPNPTEP